MEKRLILAFSLSFLLLLAWSAILPKPQHTVNKEVTEIATVSPKALNTPAPALPAPLIPKDEAMIKYQQEKFEVSFIERLAAINEIKFRDYPDSVFSLRYGFLLKDDTLKFTKQSSGPDQITFIYTNQIKKITKKFYFSKSNYSIQLDIGIQNLSSSPLTVNWPLTLGVQEFSSKDADARYQDVAIGTKEKTIHIAPKKDIEFKGVNFLAMRDRYFAAIVSGQAELPAAFIKKISNQAFEISLSAEPLIIPPGQSLQQQFRIYLGPQELNTINAVNPEWSSLIHYGTFDFISQILLQLLQFFYKLVHNWGLAIVILSVAVYFLLFPLTIKQMRSMKDMQALQPHIEELKKMYKDNPQKLQKEQMELFRKHKVNPFGGCLPLLLQMPIFFALYQTLMRCVFLKGAGFLWIKDLSNPDKLFAMPFPKPFDQFNLLPILMAIGMFIQQKFTTVPATSRSTADQQKIMLFMMPILFGFIFYSMPAGLVLYWFINSTLMLVNQIRQARTSQTK